MNIYSILGGNNLMIAGAPVFQNGDLISTEEAVVTCREGQALADLAKSYPRPSVSLFCDPVLSPKLETTVAVLDFLPKENLTVILPCEDDQAHFHGIVPASCIHGESSRAYYRLYMGEILKKVRVPRADEYVEKMTVAVMNP